MQIFATDALFEVADDLPSQIKETHHRLDIFGNINNFNLCSSATLVLSFDVTKMLSRKYNIMVVAYAWKYSNKMGCKDTPTDCLIRHLSCA